MSLLRTLRGLETERFARRYCLVVSGASGAALAARVAEAFVAHPAVERLHLVFTAPATKVLAHELGETRATTTGFIESLALEGAERDKIQAHRDTELEAAVASGSYRIDGTAVVPCSSGMASSIACGISRGLGQRIADVALKQRWPLLLAIRETPMSAVLLSNLARLAGLGVHIAPPIPAFYLKPSSDEAIETFLDHYALRVLDLLGAPVDDESLRWA